MTKLEKLAAFTRGRIEAEQIEQLAHAISETLKSLCEELCEELQIEEPRYQQCELSIQ
jgi:hypothetical protein